MRNHLKAETGLSEEDEDICVDIFRNIMRVRHLMYMKAAAVAEQSGLHAAELNVIDILGKFGPISMGRLSRETFISPSNTTNTVKKLEQAGLVGRKRSDHSDREVTVRLTRKGAQKFRVCYPRVLGDAHSLLADRLTPGERKQLADILGKLAS